jgi:hypothetical protein
VIKWDDIDCVSFSASHAEFSKDGSVVARLEYARFSYQQVQDIKAVINKIAEKYDIKIV